MRVIEVLPRSERKRLLNQEARLRASGEWGKWQQFDLPHGCLKPSGEPATGWAGDVRWGYRNAVFCVFRRHTAGVVHLAISSLSGKAPTFFEKQRIKNELISPLATAVEIFPPQEELVNDAPMNHLWIVAPVPFTIFERGHA